MIDTSEQLTLVGINCKTSEEVIRLLADRMMNGGYVKDTYVEAVLKRERVMPTGLVTKAIGVAIPHTDPEHVNKSAIAVGLLNNPVNFKNMASPEDDVPVKVVLLLAIAEKGSITSVLAALAEMFMEPEQLNKLQSMRTTADLSQYFSNLIQNGINKPALAGS
jgi:PTS system galactitol-specific IIA component